jgi:transposase InsO family protein
MTSLLKQTRYLDPQTAAPLLDMDERSVRRLCESGKLAGAVKTGDGWQIPADADSRFRPYLAVGNRVDERFQNVPADKRDEAIRRAGLISEFEKFSGQTVRGGGLRTQAMRAFCFEWKIPLASFKRWLKKFRTDGIIGLVDTRGGYAAGREMISPKAFDYFKSMYLDPRQPSIKFCYQNLTFTNKKENHGWTVPDYYALCRYVAKNISKPVEILHREGMAAFEAKCAPHIIIDQDSVEPGQVWIGDHHQFDCWIRHRNDWVRPWITAWEDYRSRKIVGHFISTSPNSTTILQATRRGIEQHGAPESVKIDNGKDYDSQVFTGQTKQQRRSRVINDDEQMNISGIYALLNIGVSFSIPYHPQSKKIERWFDTLDCRFTKTFSTYCGKDTARRPEDLAEYLKTDKAIAEAYTLESFTALVEKYIAAYNASAHTGAGMDGQSPDEVFATRGSRRAIENGVLDMLLQVWSPVLTVGKNGVKFKGLWFGQFNSELMRHFGKQVRVAYNPDDITRVSVHDAATYKLITTAEQATLIQYGPVSEEALREAMANKARAIRLVKQSRPAGRVAAMNLTDLTLSAMADNMRETPPEKPVNVKPVRTPLDGQAKEYLRQKNRQVLKKAVGAECENDHPNLTFWSEEDEAEHVMQKRLRDRERIPRFNFLNE